MANIGPLDSFTFPGVSTRTLLEPPLSSAAGAVRFPAFIGTGIEEERVEAYEIVRGSSATADNVIVGEDLTSNGKAPGPGQTWNTVDGSNIEFRVKFSPIADGSGTGTFATQPSQLIITVDGDSVPVFSVDGAQGIVKLIDPPAVGAVVRANYYYKNRDTYVEGEDLSVQAVAGVKTLKVRSARIVKGDNGGSAATTIDITSTGSVVNGSQVVVVPTILVTVNGVEAAITDLNGNEAVFTLTNALVGGETVIVSYFTNDYANTYDMLPAPLVTAIVRAGYDPSRADFMNGKDYVLANNNQIHWGSSVSVETGVATAGQAQFGANQVTANLVDNRIYKSSVLGTIDGVNKSFNLPYSPVRGDGTGKPMSDPLSGTVASFDDLKVFVGATLATATQATISKLSGDVVTLVAAPAAGMLIWADMYINRLVDDLWTVKKTLTGKYTIVGNSYGKARQVTLDLSASTSVATFLDQAEGSYDGVAGTCNAYIKPSRTLTDETVTLTVDSSGAFTVVSSNTANGTGSGAVKSGVVGKTYVDEVTGFTVALSAATAGTLIFSVSSVFAQGADAERGLPGLKVFVGDIASVVVGDTAVVRAYNLNQDEEPKVGDLYYVSFDKAKVDYSVKFMSSFPDVQRFYGALSQNNPVVIAAYLAFSNGAPAVAIKQLKKMPGASDAAVSDYINAISIFDEPMPNGGRPSLLQVLSTDTQVVAALKSSNAQQSSIRFKNERTSYFGFRIGTTPDAVQSRVKGLNTEVLTAVYPDGGYITLKDSFGSDQDILVGGEYLAAAMAGADVSPARDIATTLTNVQLVGFKRLYRNLTTVVASQVANAGCSVLESRFGVTKCLMALTTDLSSVLTRDPRTVEVKNFVQQGVRSNLDPFIGRKNLPGLTGQIQRSLDSYLYSLKQAQIISDYKPSKAAVNPADPSTVDVTMYYSPVMPLNWIVATLNLSSVG